MLCQFEFFNGSSINIPCHNFLSASSNPLFGWGLLGRQPGHVAPKSLIGPAVSSSLFYWSTSAASFTWPSADHVARKTLATSPRNISRLPLASAKKRTFSRSLRLSRCHSNAGGHRPRWRLRLSTSPLLFSLSP